MPSSANWNPTNPFMSRQGHAAATRPVYIAANQVKRVQHSRGECGEDKGDEEQEGENGEKQDEQEEEQESRIREDMKQLLDHFSETLEILA